MTCDALRSISSKLSSTSLRKSAAFMNCNVRGAIPEIAEDLLWALRQTLVLLVHRKP